jgi:hypothetical protein
MVLTTIGCIDIARKPIAKDYATCEGSMQLVTKVVCRPTNLLVTKQLTY